MDKITVTEHDDSIIIKIFGRFNFGVYKQFIDSYESFKNTNKTFVVNLSSVAYIDSSALGMLLNLRSFSKQQVQLISPNDHIMEVLKIANFDKIFNIK